MKTQSSNLPFVFAGPSSFTLKITKQQSYENVGIEVGKKVSRRKKPFIRFRELPIARFLVLRSEERYIESCYSRYQKKRRSEWVSFSDFLWQVSINFPHFTVCFLFCHYFMSPVALLLQTVLLGTNEGKLMTGESSYAKPHRWRCTGIILHNSWGAIVLEDNRNQSDPVWEWIEALSSKFAESGLSHPIHSFQRRKWKKW